MTFSFQFLRLADYNPKLQGFTPATRVAYAKFKTKMLLSHVNDPQSGTETEGNEPTPPPPIPPETEIRLSSVKIESPPGTKLKAQVSFSADVPPEPETQTIEPASSIEENRSGEPFADLGGENDPLPQPKPGSGPREVEVKVEQEDDLVKNSQPQPTVSPTGVTTGKSKVTGEHVGGWL